MSPTKDVMILPNAPPMMIPTAMSTTLPRIANSLNSLTIPMTLLLLLVGLLAEQAADGVAGFLGRVRSGLTGEGFLHLRGEVVDDLLLFGRELGGGEVLEDF